MRKAIFLLIAACFLTQAAGCIVSDQITTITIEPDGSADWVRFQSNIRSTEKGAKGADELRRFVEEFNSHKDADLQRITDAGGSVLDARWLRNEEPYANVVTATFPSWRALEKYFTLTDEKGNVIVRPQFVRDGTNCRLSFMIAVTGEAEPATLTEPTVAEMHQGLANSISATRVVVTNGRITAAQGFTVADDKRSALLEPAEIGKLLATNRERVDVFLEWVVPVTERPK